MSSTTRWAWVGVTTHLDTRRDISTAKGTSLVFPPLKRSIATPVGNHTDTIVVVGVVAVAFLDAGMMELQKASLLLYGHPDAFRRMIVVACEWMQQERVRYLTV